MKENESQELLEQYKQDFHADYGSFEEQRDKANEDFRFAVVSGGQWEGFLEDAYEGRAKLELDQVSDYVHRTYGQWTLNRIGVHYSPDDEKTTDDDAELLNGLYRRDFRRANGATAIDNAVLEALYCGVGAFHIATEYDDKEDVDSDHQNAVFRPIHNAYSMVVWDCAAKRIDKADAERCTVLYEYSRDAFVRKYPDAQISNAFTPDDRREFNWGTKNSVFVACRYTVKTENDMAYVFGNPITGQMETVYRSQGQDAKAEAAQLGFELLREKRIERRYVTKALFSGTEFLEDEERISGKRIPIIPIYAFRSYVDGQEHFHGLVRKRVDGQRLFNMEVSKLAEDSASANKRVPLFDPNQVKGMENLWSGDLSRKAYMPIRPIFDKNGTIIHTGPLGYLEQSPIDPNTKALIELTAQFIQTGTGGAPQETIDPDASGKAIKAVIERIDLNTQPIMENIAAAMKWAGFVYREIAADIYAQPRMIKTISEDGGENPVRLMSVDVDQESGMPMYRNDLSKGRFEVVVDTGPQYQSRREATVETLKAIYAGLDPNDPNRSAILGMLIENLDGTGIEDLREYNRRRLLLMGIRKPETDEERQLLDNMSQQADPQQKLVEAAAQQQLAEAQQMKASAVQKIEDAKLKRAKALETVDGMKARRMEMLLDVLED